MSTTAAGVPAADPAGRSMRGRPRRPCCHRAARRLSRNGWRGQPGLPPLKVALRTRDLPPNVRPPHGCRPRRVARGWRRCAGSGRDRMSTSCRVAVESNACFADGGTCWRRTLSATACTHHGRSIRARPASPHHRGYSRRSHWAICCGDQSSSSLAATTPASSAFAASLLTFGRRALSNAAASAASAR